MTDRHMGYVVVLDHNIREDDAESTVEAIRHIKGVLGVSPVIGEPLVETIIRSRVLSEVSTSLYNTLRSLQ